MPVRIQQRRTAGWRKPPGAVSVARPTRWGNPFRVGMTLPPDIDWIGSHPTRGDYPFFALTVTPALAAALYSAYVVQRDHIALIRADLAGRDLMCFCPLDQPCHADVLLAIANT